MTSVSKKLLCIDDEEDYCVIFAQIAEILGHQVKTFTNEEEGAAESFSYQPDIVFVDYRLTHTSGDQLAKKLPSDCKKVLVTGELNVKSSFEFDAYLYKPFKIDNLKATIEELLS